MTGVEVFITLKDVKLPQGGAKAVAHEAFEFLATMRQQVTDTVREIMRSGVSAAIGLESERESVITIVEPGPRPTLRSSSQLIQAAVDEEGRVSGGMPPFGPGSLLREWVVLTLAPDPKNEYLTARNVAFRIMDRGLPRPGDPLRMPFHTAYRTLLPEIQSGLEAAVPRAAAAINVRFFTYDAA